MHPAQESVAAESDTSVAYVIANRRAYRLRHRVRGGVAAMLAGGTRRGQGRTAELTVRAPAGSDLADDLATARDLGLSVATFPTRRGRRPVNLFIDNPTSNGAERRIYAADGSRTFLLPYGRTD